MSDLRERLKAKKAKELTVVVDGDSFLVRGIGRVQKNALVERCQDRKTGRMNTPLFESEILAACVCDPSSGEPVMPNPDDWDIPADVSGPLIDACTEVCGFNRQEREQVKNSEPTES